MSVEKTHICEKCGSEMMLIGTEEYQIEKNRHVKNAIFFKKGYDKFVCLECEHEINIEHKREKVAKGGTKVTEKLTTIVEGEHWLFESYKKFSNGSGAIFVLRRDGYYTYLGVTYNKQIMQAIETNDAREVKMLFLAEIRESKKGILELNLTEII